MAHVIIFWLTHLVMRGSEYIGYCDEATQVFCEFVSLQALFEEAQHNLAHGYRDEVSAYLSSFGGRWGNEIRFSMLCLCDQEKMRPLSNAVPA
jgi:hypothetical protein